ncbi:sulfurtransferase [Pseudomonadota bacterium]
MLYRTLIGADVLARHISDPSWVVIDCRFSLSDATAGEFAYEQGHIPGAYYAHLGKDLSAPVGEATGRHPLPDVAAMNHRVGGWGISPHSQVVVYDDMNGAMAARLWWLLRWLGHDAVAVLDGGWQQWLADGWESHQSPHVALPAMHKGEGSRDMWLSAAEVEKQIEENEILLLDARTPERFRGEVEPIDPVAGHVPGAMNRPFQLNVDKQGLFKPRHQLAQEFGRLLSGRPAEQVVHMCGSGVTACHNLLAMEYAGLAGSRLYAGSWSEWICDLNRPVGKSG